MKSLAARLRADDANAEAIDRALGNESEWSFSCVGLVYLLSFWASSVMVRGHAETLRERSTVFLRLLCHRLLRSRTVSRTATGGFGIKIVEGKLVVEALREQVRALRRASAWKTETLPVTDALVSLAGFLQRSTGASEALRSEARGLLVAVVETLSLVFDLLDDTVDAHASLPVLRLKSTRARRISQTTKRDFRQVARDTAGAKHAQQVVAIDKSLKRARGQEEDMPSAGAARKFVKDGMFAYMHSSHKHWASCGHVSVALDGVRVDNDDLVSYVFYDTKGKCGTWSPPQAQKCPKITRQRVQKNGFHRFVTPVWGYVCARVFGRKTQISSKFGPKKAP